MAGEVLQGSIVWVRVNDPQGGNPKPRPAVVLSVENENAVICAITSQKREPLPTSYVPIPWSADGSCSTGLRKECFAVSTWLLVVNLAQVLEISGRAKSPVVQGILSKLPVATIEVKKE